MQDLLGSNLDENAERSYWIALNLIPSMTAKKFKILLENFQSAEEIWKAPLAQLKVIEKFSRYAEDFSEQRAAVDLAKEIEHIKKRKLAVLTLLDAEYPKPLRAIDDPPPVLYVKGSYITKDELAIAIVGTRKPSPYGKMISEKLSRELGAMGFTIISGMALGIDTAAHQGALAASQRTIAVLGGGFAKIYPSENRNLLEKIASSGAVLSEYSIETTPDKWTFPKRNRIISGLTRGTIVIEAPERSGALITARCALEQGREVFAVPGPISDESHSGTHKLIQDGAKLIRNADDILNEFADLRKTLEAKKSGTAQHALPALSPLEQKIFSILQFDPIHFNDVVERTGLSTSEVSFALLQLVMKNLVKELDGKRFAKLP